MKCIIKAEDRRRIWLIVSCKLRGGLSYLQVNRDLRVVPMKLKDEDLEAVLRWLEQCMRLQK
jgi:hypothetical protein